MKSMPKVFILLCVFYSGAVFAATTEASAAEQNTTAQAASEQQSAAQLRVLLDAMNTLQGKFTQTLYDIKGESLEESTGTFVLQRPGKFYWKTEQRYPQLLVSNQETIWLFEPELEQVTVRPFSNDLQRTPALLLSEDVNKLRENFIIQRELVDTQQEKFTLIPKVSKGLFQQLSLVFVAGELQAFYLQDNLGQATHFTLREVERNLAVDAALFNFTPPPGVDVLND